MNRALERLASDYPAKRVFITGAASGLGLELSTRFAEAGWSVGMFDRDRRQLASAAANLKDARVLPLEGDVTDREDVESAMVAFRKFAGTPDILVNSAGVAAGGDFSKMRMEDFVGVTAVNFLGPITLCQALIPAMRRRKKGLIVNVSSAAAFASLPSMSAYNASKAALLSLSETLAGELACDNIQVCVFMPGFFLTALLKDMRGPRHARKRAQRLMEASRYTVKRAANDLLRGMARGRVHIVAPWGYRMLWRFKRLFPGAFTRRLAALAARDDSI